MYNSFDDPRHHAVVVQLSSKLHSNRLERLADPLYYTWASGSCVVTITYYATEENLSLLRTYIEKYPSSIH